VVDTMRAPGLVRKGAHRSGSVTAVPAQQLPDDVSNVALRRSGPGPVE
jgi:hypothetical protein